MRNLNQELDLAAKITNPFRRTIKVAALISEALQAIGQDPVLVGGSAVEFYTEGGYVTADLDFVSAGGPRLVVVMQSLGFERIGKDFVDKKRKVYVEFPGDFLSATERADTVTIDGFPLKIISREDLIVDRLCAYKFWKSALDGYNALLLLESPDIDKNRLMRRAKEEDVLEALKVVENILEESVRNKLARSESNRRIEREIKNL